MSASGHPHNRWLAAYVAAYLVFLYLPIALIPLFSFNASIQALWPVKNDRWALVRPRQSYEELIGLDRLAAWQKR